ncbi:MAG: hypothetical protein ACREE7_10730, partial [Dongiaceae bacterium]
MSGAEFKQCVTGWAWPRRPGPPLRHPAGAGTIRTRSARRTRMKMLLVLVFVLGLTLAALVILPAPIEPR